MATPNSYPTNLKGEGGGVDVPPTWEDDGGKRTNLSSSPQDHVEQQLAGLKNTSGLKRLAPLEDRRGPNRAATKYPATTYAHLTGYTVRAMRQAFEGDLFIPGITTVATPEERSQAGIHSEVIVAYQALGKAVTPAPEFTPVKVHNAA